MMEHQACLSKHVDLGAASVWRLRELVRLMALDVCHLHIVYQSQYGMAAMKPTFFPGRRLDSFEVCPQQIRAFSGRNDDGTFKMAVVKKYPAPLC